MVASQYITQFDDHGCTHETGVQYVCSTNDKGGPGIYGSDSHVFTGSYSVCRDIQGEWLARTCLPSRPLDQLDVFCEALNPDNLLPLAPAPPGGRKSYTDLQCCGGNKDCDPPVGADEVMCERNQPTPLRRITLSHCIDYFNCLVQSQLVG